MADFNYNLKPIIYPNLISKELSGLCHCLMNSYQLSVKDMDNHP